MRILVDCSGLNIHQPLLTGIPRVVQNYLCHGYDFGAAHGVQVLPVRMRRGRLVFQSASVNFPHPPQGEIAKPRRGPLRLAERGLQALALGGGYALYALPWLGFQAYRRMQRDKARADAVNAACNRFGQVLLEPSDQLGRLYHRAPPVALQKDDILFCPAYWHDAAPARYAALAGKVAHRAVLVHDIIPVSHPQYYRAPWRDMFRRNVAAALDNFDSTVAISGYTAQMLRQHFPDQAAAAQIAVCRNGLERLSDGALAQQRHMAAFAGESPYLMVGTIEPKKGHLAVLDALESLWNEGRVTRRLVVIGRHGWMYESVVARLQSMRQSGRVIWLQDADDEALAYAYRHAHALIHASEVEGFGLPMIECAAAGTPVLARRSAISAEVLGRFGRFYDGEDPASLCDAILAMEQPEHHAALRAELDGFYWADWRKVTWALFSALCAAAANGQALPQELWPAPAAMPDDTAALTSRA